MLLCASVVFVFFVEKVKVRVGFVCCGVFIMFVDGSDGYVGVLASIFFSSLQSTPCFTAEGPSPWLHTEKTAKTATVVTIVTIITIVTIVTDRRPGDYH